MEEMNNKQIYKMTGKYKQHEKDGKFMYINSERGRWFRSNLSGSNIINLIDGNRSLKELVESLSVDYNIPVDAIQGDTMAFLKGLVAHKHICLSHEDTSEIRSSATNDTLPGSIWIHPNASCNLNCPYCYNKSGEYKDNKTLNWKDLSGFFEYIKTKNNGNKKISIVISGGEPTLRPKELKELIEQLRNTNIINRIALLTNGTNTSFSLWKDILPLIDVVQISLDGATPEVNDKTRSKESFGKVIETIKVIQSIGSSCYLGITLTPTKYNIHEIPSFVTLAVKLNVNMVAISRLRPLGRYKDNQEIQMNNQDYISILEEAKKIYQKEHRLFKLKKDDSSTFPVLKLQEMDCITKVNFSAKRTNCGAGLGSMSISHNGNVQPCASFYESKFVLGNIFNNTPQEILDKALEFGENHSVDKVEFCQNCDVRHICGGCCRAISYSLHESPLRADTSIISLSHKTCGLRDDIYNVMWSMPDYAID